MKNMEVYGRTRQTSSKNCINKLEKLTDPPWFHCWFCQGPLNLLLYKSHSFLSCFELDDKMLLTG